MTTGENTGDSHRPSVRSRSLAGGVPRSPGARAVDTRDRCPGQRLEDRRGFSSRATHAGLEVWELGSIEHLPQRGPTNERLEGRHLDGDFSVGVVQDLHAFRSGGGWPGNRIGV